MHPFAPKTLLGIGALLLLAGLAYSPMLHGGFILDDDLYLTENPTISAPDGLYRFWFTTEAVDYYPLTNTAFWFQWRWWGTDPTGYHVINLALHVVAAILIWAILRKLSIPGAYLAALLYTVHPVNVESVAWISQLKNELAILFFLLSILWYLPKQSQSLIPRPSSLAPSRYWLSLLSFLLAMLSKGSVAILPVILLGIILWQRRPTRRDWIRLAPFWAIAIALTALNIWCTDRWPEAHLRNAPLVARIVGAGSVVWFYLAKALLPIRLIFVYPQWQIQSNQLLWWLPLLAALVATATLLRKRNSAWGRPLLFAWGFFCVALLPVLGFTDTGFMRFSLVADHYQHIAIIGVVTLAAAAWRLWHQRSGEILRPVALVVAAGAVSVLTYLTWQQTHLYADAVTLYQSTLNQNPDSVMVHYNLGLELTKQAQWQPAIEQFLMAIRLKPDYAEAHNNLGTAFRETNRLPEAIQQYQLALQSNPNFAEAHNNLGLALADAGRTEEAIHECQAALRLKPNFPEAQNNLGIALANAGRLQDAIEHYQLALQLKPDFAEAYNNLGNALTTAGHPDKAISNYQQAIKLNSDHIQFYVNLALAYSQMHHSSEAIAAAEKALDLAHSQGQTALAQKIEKWLTSARANQPGAPNALP